jgi:hypothetical protein
MGRSWNEKPQERGVFDGAMGVVKGWRIILGRFRETAEL